VIIAVLSGICRSLDFIVVEGGLDGVLGQHGAVEFNRRQAQFLGNVRVPHLIRLLQTLSLDPLRGQGAGRDGRRAAERLELGVDDLAVRVHLDLQLHDVAAGRGPDQARPDVLVVLVQRADILRFFKVFDDVLVVSDDGCELGGLDLGLYMWLGTCSGDMGWWYLVLGLSNS